MGERLVLGVDLDNVITDPTAHLQRYLEEVYPGRFTGYHFEPITHEEKIDKEFPAARFGYLRTGKFIPELPLHEGVPLAVSMLWSFFDRLHINTARWEDQRPFIDQLLEKHDMARDITSVLLRQDPKLDQTEAKLLGAQQAEMNYVVEDHAMLACLFSECGIKVALIDQPWNRNILNSPNIRRYNRLIDFAFDLVMHKTPEKLFKAHRESLENPKYAHRMHGIVVPQGDFLSFKPEPVVLSF